MYIDIKKLKIVPIGVLVILLVFVFGSVLKSLISASGVPWVQTDWSSGVGASTTTQYQSGTNVNVSTSGEVSILPLERLSNTNFESDINSWDVGTSPSSIAGLSLWLKADSIVGLNDGDTVGSWTDQSPNVNSANQLTEILKPLYKTNILNGKPVVRFDGGNDEMTISQGITHGTTFIVGKRSSTSSPFAEVGGGSIGNRRGLIGIYYPAYASYDEYYVNGTSVPNGGGGAINTQLIFTGRSPTTPVNSTSFRLGYGSPSYASLNGDIAEIIIYDTSLTSTNRQLIESYLQKKYGISAGYLTVIWDVATTYASSAGSAKIVAGSLGGNFTQSVNVGDTDSYNLNVYAYTTGAAITSSDAELFYNGSVISTSYTSVGGGWYKLTGTLTGSNSIRQYGVQVKGGKTIYLDNFSVNKFTSATLTSNIYDTTTVSDYGILTYTATTPGGSSVSVKVRTGNQSDLSDASNFNVCAATLSGVDLSGGCSPDNKRYVQYELALTGNGSFTPTFSDITIDNSISDLIPPSVNATSMIMYRTNGGTTVNSQEWISSLSPKFSWTAGVDESGIKGYCLRLVSKASLAPSFDDTSPTDLTNVTFNSSGLVNSANSPVGTAGTDCTFIVNSTEIDFSNQSYRENPWFTTSSDLYYLFVKVIDVGNNMYVGPASFFKFKFDSTVPSNVSYISSASGTFGNVSDMNFSWPVSGGTASSDNDSGILGWQYQINSSGGTWQGTDISIPLGVNYIPSDYSSFPYFLSSIMDGPNVQIGNNVIYFRTIDVAGNVSSPATLRTANISFGGEAPTFPGSCDNTTGITITPTTSASNSFSLSWPAATPAPGRTISKYYYMVNTEPPSTLATITSNTATYTESLGTSVASAPLAAVVKGSNSVYVVAVDDINIYSSTNCLKGTFTLNSTLPDSPLNLSVSDTSIKSASIWRASLAWNTPVYKGTGILSYVIDRSEDGSTWTNVDTTSGTAFLDTVSESKRYYWRVSTIDNTIESQNAPSASNAVTLIPKGVYTEAPTLTSSPQALDISTKRAKVSWTTSREADSKIAFGTASGVYFNEEVYSSTKETNHLIFLSNLTPATLYYYVARWTDEDGNTGTSPELSFRTLEAPRVKDVSVTNISISSALIKYTSKGASSVKIYYGKSTDFGGVKEIPTSPVEAPYTSQLTGLDDGTKYYYKINSLDADGNEYQGTVLDFTTLPRPRLFDINFSQIRGTAQPSVLVSWNSNTEVSTVVSYYEASNSAVVKDETNPNLIKGINRAILRSLNPETNYAMVIKARDKVGNEVVSDVYQFTTAIDTRPPTISSLKVESVVLAKSGQSTGAQIIVSWNTDKPATSQVEFGEGTNGNYSQKTQEETNLKQNHLVVISDLTPSKVYSIRALSRDKAGNIGKSSGNNTLTPKSVDSALDIVITILSDAFSFLSGINK